MAGADGPSIPQRRSGHAGRSTGHRCPSRRRSTLLPIAASVDARAISGIAVGGGSDGNFTAALGVPTLDGLGAVGGGAHADTST